MNENLDICLVCQGMNGGVGTYIHNMYTGLRKKGCRVNLACRELELKYLNDFIRESDIFILPTLDYRKGVSAFTSFLEVHKPEVIVTPQLRPTITALRARAAINSKAKIFPVIHNTYSLELKRLKLPKMLSRQLRLRYYYPKCDGIVAVSNGVADDFIKMTAINHGSVSVIYNPMNISHIQSRAAEPLDHPWFETGEPPVILGIGRLVWQKNFQLLIDSFEIVRSRIPARLMILGEGPERKNLEHRIRNSQFQGDITMPGHVPNPYQYLKNSALFALSSNYEGLPTVLIEALATGTPVVSTDCPSGPREILADGRYGFIVPLNESGKFAEAIVETLRNPLPGELLTSKASEFDIQSSAENYLKLFGMMEGDKIRSGNEGRF